MDPRGLTDLLHCAQMLGRHLDTAMQEKIGIGWAQFRIMDLVQANPAARQRAIAGKLGQTEASVSRQITLLCQRGLLVVETNPQNRREHTLVLTVKGARMTDAARTVLHDCASSLWSDMPEKQQKAFRDIMPLLHARICYSGKPAGCQ